MKLLEGMILKNNFIYFSILIILNSCQGTHGKIVEFHASVCMREMHDEIIELTKKEYIVVNDSTDNSGLNRPGYMDIKLLSTDIIKEVTFQIHFRGTQELWDTQKNRCIFSIIRINGKTNAKLGFFSKVRRESLVVFNETIIPLLEKRVGEIEDN